MEKYLKTLHPVFNKKIMTNCIELILNNTFLQRKPLSKENYIQTLGTTMETKMVTKYAILTLAYLTGNFIEFLGIYLQQY